ncbi:MAG: transglutaminase domain-containing protein [Chloroflexi bacterium]|nr:transglutaminase domain-containing protein [Chloroflexota bacterium]
MGRRARASSSEGAAAHILLATNVFYAATGQEWLLLLMAALVLLSVRLQQFHREQAWTRHQVDFSPEYRLDLYVVSGFATVGIMAMMLMAPNVRLQPVVNAFWSFFDAPYLQIERRSERLLTGLDRPPRRLIGGGDVTIGGLPRAHLLGGAPALSEQVVLRVRIDSPLPPNLTPNYRWRALTFSVYNGRGWENPPPIDVQRYKSGEIWAQALAESRPLLQQSFDFGRGQPYWLYALAEPVMVDRPYRVHLRAPGDPVGLDIRAGRYTVISALANASEAAMRAAPPADAQALAPYLQLPPDIPPRVYKLARTLGARLDNAYDQARAIEAYLRRYRYNLQVPSPPVQRDVVDWFLFDLRQGYCDYYATSMVVMARSLGIPARLAIGYAPGTLDPETGWMTVTEADAHSWPELYFEGLGWIPFEPTAARVVYVWPASAPAPEDQSLQNAAANAATLERLRRRLWWTHGLWRWPVALLLVLGLSLAIRTVGREWLLRRRAQHAWQLGYWRLATWGQKWGIATADWLTPTETRQLWALALHQEPLPDRLVQETMTAIDALMAGMMQRSYAPAHVWLPDAQARRIWRRLRWHLWSVRLHRVWQRLWRHFPGPDSSL